MNQECSVRIEKLETKIDAVVEEKENVVVQKEENGVVEEKENANTLNKTDENAGQVNVVSVRRYSTRSSVSRTESLEITSEIQRKRPRSATEPRPKPAYIEYKGKVEYFTDFHDIAFAADTLL